MRIVTMVLCWLAAMPAFAQEGVMTFEGYPPDPARTFFTGTSWTINASGVIDDEAGKRFERFLVEKQIPVRSFVFLDSAGGNVVGAMRLGRVFREHGLVTHVGQSRGYLGERKPGKCFSACALAYLGGDFRYLLNGSEYGVHRFSFDNASADDADTAQIASAAIVEYIREMDVDTELFSIAANAGKDDLVLPPRSVLESLNVINNGAKKARWSIESVEDGMYFKGEQETIFGTGKFMLICPGNGKVTLHVMFDQQGRADEAMKMPTQSLLIDGKPFYIERYARARSRMVIGGWFNALYSVDDDMLRRIRSAKTIGFALQRAKADSYFLGFDGMPMTDAQPKLPGFLAVCGKATDKRTAR